MKISAFESDKCLQMRLCRAQPKDMRPVRRLHYYVPFPADKFIRGPISSSVHSRKKSIKTSSLIKCIAKQIHGKDNNWVCRGKNSTKCVHQNYFKKPVMHWYQRSSSGSIVQMLGLSTTTKRLSCKAGGKLRFPNYSDRSKRKGRRQTLRNYLHRKVKCCKHTIDCLFINTV